jgi:hypothetical protein
VAEREERGESGGGIIARLPIPNLKSKIDVVLQLRRRRGADRDRLHLD